MVVNTKTGLVAMALVLSVSSGASAADRAWAIRADANVGLLGVALSSDSDHKVPVPLLSGHVVGSYNLEHVSFEYGMGGPIFSQTFGVRVRPIGFGGSRGRHAFYLGGDYVLVLGGSNVAQFAAAELGYEYVAGNGFTLVAGAGAFAVITSFKDDETSGAGPRVRLGLGYSF